MKRAALAMLVLAGLLQACGEAADDGETRRWMEQQKLEVEARPAPAPASAASMPAPLPGGLADLADPFHAPDVPRLAGSKR